MKRFLLDTNILIRAIVDDDAEQADLVGRLLELAASKDAELIATDLVVIEAAWVLRSVYKLPREDTADALAAFLVAPGVTTDRLQWILKALNVYREHNVDIVDAFLAVYQGLYEESQLATFDAKLRRLVNYEVWPPEPVK